MKYQENDERNSRLKRFGAAAAGLTIAAFAVKDSGNLKYFSKAFNDVEKTASSLSKDFSSKALKDIDYSFLKKTINRNLLDEDSVWKTARKDLSNEIELNYNGGLLSSLLHLESIGNNTSTLKYSMFDSLQKDEILNKMSDTFKDKSEDFISQLHNLVDSSLRDKSSFFNEESEGIDLIKSKFDEVVNGSLLEKDKDTIYKIYKQAINSANDLQDDFNVNYESSLKEDIIHNFKDEIKNKFSKDSNKEFFDKTLDRAATVNELIKANDEQSINIKNKNLQQLGDNDIIGLLKNLVNEDSDFGNLIVDKTLRINDNNEIYSTLGIKKAKDSLEEGLADTIPGKLFFGRSFADLKKAPDVYYFAKNSFDSVLSGIDKSDNNFLNNNYLKLEDSLYKIVDSKLEKVNNDSKFYLMSGQHGTLNVLNNRLAGNFSYKTPKTAAQKYFDINTTGVTVLDKFKGLLYKYNENSDWIKNSEKRIFNQDTYKNINVESSQTFSDDIKKINKLYNKRTKAIDSETIKSLSNILHPKAAELLKALESENPSESVLKVKDSFYNKDLNTLLARYKHDINTVDNLAQIGTLGGKNGINILNYKELLKREVVKESLLVDAKSNNPEHILSGYSTTLGKLSKAKITNKERNNVRNIFDWAILQQETETFSSTTHKMSNATKKMTLMNKFGDLMKRSSSNEQLNTFLEGFRKNVDQFINENVSAKDVVKPARNDIIKAQKNNSWVLMRKAVNPLDIIKSLNDDEKLKATMKDFAKQFNGGRDNKSDITTATLLSFHMLNRLTTPLEAFGLGFSKMNTKSAGDLAKAIGLKRILPIVGIAYGLSYLNFEAENLTGNSFTQDYQNARANFGLGVKTIQQMFGLDSTLRRSRMYNPITNYWLGDYKDKDEYLDYLENGYDPVRKGRWWNFGSTSEFRGSTISYWEPNKIRQAYSHYRDVSLYGSEDEKWKHSWIPTPRHPLSPIRNLLDPYWLERKHYWDRPYPVTAPLFSEGTPWGAILNPTLGQIIKPQRRMHQSELQGTLLDVRSIIARKNQEIRDKSPNNRVIRVDQGGFTPMEYAPQSSPSLNERVLSLKVGNGKVQYAEYEGEKYPENLQVINDNIVGSYNEYSNNDTTNIVSKLVRGNSKKNDAVSNILINGLSTMITSGAPSKQTSLNIISGLNNSIKYKSRSMGMAENGVIIENAKWQKNPIDIANMNAKDKYLTHLDISEIGTKNEYVNNLMYSAKELSGMYGFLLDTILPPSHGYRLENAGKMSSFVNRYWSESLGGWGSDFMEIARRFFPHENHDIENINPIRNTMPLWLPERFQTGDPYTKVTKGEARLPGKGYETLNKLHPDQYGRYGAFDRYKILADVSPGSDEYKIWKKIAKQEITDFNLKKQMSDIEKRVSEQEKSHSFYNYKFLGKTLETHKAVIESVTNTGQFKVVGDDETYQIAGIKPLKDENKQSYIHEYLKPGMIVQLEWEKNKYRDRLSTGEISAIVKYDGENISQKMWEEGKAKEKDNKETLADELFAANDMNMTFGPFMELIAHAQIPYFHNKFLRIDSPMESYKKEQIYGNSYSTWEHPIKGFIDPALHNAWSKGPVAQAIGLGTWYYSNKAINEDWKGIKKYAAHTLFAFTNPGGLAGGILGALPRMSWGSEASKWNSKNLANIGATVGLVGYGFANLNNPFLSMGNFSVAGAALAKQLKIPFKDGVLSSKEGALIGAATGLALSAIKNPGFSLNHLTDKYIPKDTKKKWEVEEYFDRLEYLKYDYLYKRAAKLAKRKDNVDIGKIINKYDYDKQKNEKEIVRLQKQKIKAQKYIADDAVKNDLISTIDYQIYNLQIPEQYFTMGKYTKAALAYKKAADTTIYGLTKDSSQADVLRALPTYDRDYFLEFAKEKDPEEQKKILKMVSPYKRKALEVLWGKDPKRQETNYEYFKYHKLPGLFWSGWKNNVDLDNVKIKTIKNEGMLLSDFGIYDSKLNEPEVQSAQPVNMKQHTGPLALETDMLALLNGVGLDNVDVSVEQTSTPGLQFVTNIERVTRYTINQKIKNTLYNIF